MAMHSVAMLSLALLPHTSEPRPPAIDSVLARKLHWAALDQQAVLNYDSALVLLQAARRADATYFPAQFDYVTLRAVRFEHAVLREESVVLARSADPIDRCLGIAMAGSNDSRSTFRELLVLERANGVTTCSAAFLAIEEHRDYPDSLRQMSYARALRGAPEAVSLWQGYATSFVKSRNWAEVERILHMGRLSARHPLSRMSLALREVDFLRQKGDTAASLALRRSLRAAMERDGRPGLRALYGGDECARDYMRDAGDDERNALPPSRMAGDWSWVAQTLHNCGYASGNRGEHLKAIEYLTRAVPIADSVRRPDLYLQLYVQRGRAYAKLGRLLEAEQDLRRALVLGAGAGRIYNVADAYHNLAHMYESAGRWSEASRASERFVVLARPMSSSLRLTSLLDAGEIRWKAGWHASARAAFEEMVRVADEVNAERYWAGRYYERVGDLQHAREYYAKALAQEGGKVEARTALARVYEKLGHLDSAEAVARVHDAQERLWTPLEVPLLPSILARQGRHVEALRIARAWAARQEQRGNVQGAALAFLQLARLELDARATREALVSATHAEGLATTLHLATERVQSVTLRGRALRQLGLLDSAVSTLRRAARLARIDSTADNLLDAHLALGDALAERGHTEAALEAFDRAARATERVTGSLLEDLDRARYRDRHLLSFDGAIQVLVRDKPGSARVDQLVAWSARRKAAALALATRNVALGLAVADHHRTVPEVQRLLGAGDALLDYLVLDSVVAAIVITRENVSLVHLPVAKDSLGAMVERLRRPLVAVIGGRLDLARAPFSLSTAARLHEVLVHPLALALAGKRRLMIVPDGPLHALSFEALVSATPMSRPAAPDYEGAQYLIDAYEIDYLPSTSFLAGSESQRVAPLADARLLVVSYGAPGAEREANALREAWPAGRTTVLQGDAATERAASAAMSRFGVVHFVVHAQASARDPLASHLRLVPDSLEDGYLNLAEIAAAKIGARLVVLSACETDAGPIYNGEGVMGLARAFLASGARAVIGTQWPVGPTMADLMGQFYGRLAIGEAPSPALRAAKLTLRSKRETAHPFYWAGAVLVAGGGGR